MKYPAMIFAAGFGTRMGALTKHTPKPMVPLAGRPMIDHSIDLLKEAGVDRIVANTHYLRHVIDPYLTSKGIQISPEEPDILETGGGLKAARALLGSDTVITLNPDAVWLGQNPIKMLLDAWQPEMKALLLLVPLGNAITAREDGDFSLENRKIRRQGPYLYTGAQMIRVGELERIDQASFSLNQYWDLLAKDAPLNGISYEGKWCDIGTPKGLADAESLLNV